MKKLKEKIRALGKKPPESSGNLPERPDDAPESTPNYHEQVTKTPEKSGNLSQSTPSQTKSVDLNQINYQKDLETMCESPESIFLPTDSEMDYTKIKKKTGTKPSKNPDEAPVSVQNYRDKVPEVLSLSQSTPSQTTTSTNLSEIKYLDNLEILQQRRMLSYKQSLKPNDMAMYKSLVPPPRKNSEAPSSARTRTNTMISHVTPYFMHDLSRQDSLATIPTPAPSLVVSQYDSVPPNRKPPQEPPMETGLEEADMRIMGLELEQDPLQSELTLPDPESGYAVGEFLPPSQNAGDEPCDMADLESSVDNLFQDIEILDPIGLSNSIKCQDPEPVINPGKEEENEEAAVSEEIRPEESVPLLAPYPKQPVTERVPVPDKQFTVDSHLNVYTCWFDNAKFIQKKTNWCKQRSKLEAIQELKKLVAYLVHHDAELISLKFDEKVNICLDSSTKKMRSVSWLSLFSEIHVNLSLFNTETSRLFEETNMNAWLASRHMANIIMDDVDNNKNKFKAFINYYNQKNPSEAPQKSFLHQVLANLQQIDSELSASEGYYLHINSVLPENWLNYRGSYLLIRNDDERTLFFVRPDTGLRETVMIKNFPQFEMALKELMTEDEQTVHLSKQQIKELIVANSEHLYVDAEMTKFAHIKYLTIDDVNLNSSQNREYQPRPSEFADLLTLLRALELPKLEKVIINDFIEKSQSKANFAILIGFLEKNAKSLRTVMLGPGFPKEYIDPLRNKLPHSVQMGIPVAKEKTKLGFFKKDSSKSDISPAGETFQFT